MSVVYCAGGCDEFIDTDFDLYCDKCECCPITGTQYDETGEPIGVAA